MNNRIVCDSYLNFVRQSPCLISGNRSVDPHHLIARGQRECKRNDFTCVPLRRFFHSELEQIGQEKFEAKYKVNLWKEAALLQARFWSLTYSATGIGGRVQIRVGPKKHPVQVDWHLQ